MATGQWNDARPPRMRGRLRGRAPLQSLDGRRPRPPGVRFGSEVCIPEPTYWLGNTGNNGIKHFPGIGQTMPEVTKSSKWFVRITQPHEFVRGQLAGMTEWKDIVRVICVSHIGSKSKREHVHLLLELSEALQQQAVRVRFKKFFTEKLCITLKEWDGRTTGQTALSYLWHDPTHTIMFNKGFTEAELSSSKRVCEEVQAIVAQKKTRASGHCVQRVLDKIKTLDRKWSRQEICVEILSYVRDGELYEPGDFQLRKYVEEVYAKQLNFDQWKAYAFQRAQTLFMTTYEESYRL